MKSTLIVIVITFIMFSCKPAGNKYVYPQDESISTNNGMPRKRFINYFPITSSMLILLLPMIRFM